MNPEFESDIAVPHPLSSDLEFASLRILAIPKGSIDTLGIGTRTKKALQKAFNNPKSDLIFFISSSIFHDHQKLEFYFQQLCLKLAKKKNMPIHHVGLVVPDLEEGKAFYLAALAPLGYKEFHSYPGFAVGLGVSATQSDFWLSAGKSLEGGPNKPPSEGLHFAFKAESREVVDQFHEAALKAGGKDNGAPGLRKYAPGYYAAFILDLNGNNIEVVHI